MTRLRYPRHARVHRSLAVAVTTACVAGLVSTAAFAQTSPIAVHGAMRNNAGGPVSDGVYQLSFALYLKKGDAKPIWSEGPLPVAVKAGGFAHRLGLVKKLTVNEATGLRRGWIGVSIGGDPELPRQELSSVMWSLMAERALDVKCTGCIKGSHIAAASVSAQQVGFSYAGSTTKGGPASKALDLQCTGCVSTKEMKFDGDIDLGGKSLKAAKVTTDSLVTKQAAANAVTASTVKASQFIGGEFVGSGAKLTGIKLPEGTCPKGQFVRGINPDGTLQCAVAMDAANLPPDGLNEISNDLLTNQFTDAWGLDKAVPVQDNSPVGTSVSVNVGDVGLAQWLKVKVKVTNSDIAHLTLELTDPNGGKATLYAKSGKGKVLTATYSDKSKLPKGSLAGWVGKNPKGKWTLKVIDSKFLNNKTDGSIERFEVSIGTLSSKKVQVNGELLFRYHVNTEHPIKCTAATIGFAYFNKKLDALLICTGTKWRAIGAPIGIASNPAKSCKQILDQEGKTAASGTYHIDVPGHGVTQVYCDMKTDGGGWMLVWKHSYYQVGKVNGSMTFFSKTLRSCPDLKDGWCNVPNKTKFGATEQMTSATHKGTLVFAYKGKLNSQLDSAWQGAILSGYKKLVDKCASSNGSPPEPEAGSHAYKGITFDKTKVGNYTSNCDTDRHGQNGSDCRWENCTLPGSISSKKNHTQQTYYIWIR